MVVQVHKVGEEFTVVLPPHAVKELDLSEGSSVEVRRIEDAVPAIRHASMEAALKAFEDTLPQHEAAYRELAK